MGKENNFEEQVKKHVEEEIEEGGIEDILVQKPSGEEHKYTGRQKISLLLGFILFLIFAFMPTPSTFLNFCVKHYKFPQNLLNQAVEKDLVILKNGKIEVKNLENFLSFLKSQNKKAYLSITKKAHKMKIVLALAILMAIWWIGEAIPLPATALLPLVVLPLFGAGNIKHIAPYYASKIIFLFMGGFMIAAAMMKWNLHKRLALIIIDLIGVSPRRVVLGFMVATAFLSMWISNTATTMMMMPIGLAIILHVARIGLNLQKHGELQNVDFRAGRFRFGAALMLGIAYAASIGGIATIIGTPPNAVFVGTFNKLFPNAPEVTFAQWLMFGVPISLVMLIIAWFVMVYFLNPPEISELPGGKEIIKKEKEKLGPWSRGEKLVLLVFILTALAWIMGKPKKLGSIVIPGISSYLPLVNDYVIAMLSAVLLFIIPADWKKGKFLLDWDQAKTIPWGILLLFGGGIALSAYFTKSGLAYWIGDQLLFLKHFPPIVILFAVVTLVIFLTELTSNTAIATLMMPIMASFAIALGEDPRLFMISAAIAASCAFMLPVATPPNAIVFGTGYVTIPQMVKNGIVLNIICMFLITIMCYILLPAVLGIKIGVLPAWVK